LAAISGIQTAAGNILNGDTVLELCTGNEMDFGFKECEYL